MDGVLSNESYVADDIVQWRVQIMAQESDELRHCMVCVAQFRLGLLECGNIGVDRDSSALLSLSLIVLHPPVTTARTFESAASNAYVEATVLPFLYDERCT